MARTTRLNDALTDRIAAHVRNGSYLSAAAESCGVSHSTASDWFRMGLGTHPERAQTEPMRRFAEAILQAEAEHETGTVEYLSQHPDWRARLAVLSRRQRERWGDAPSASDGVAAVLEFLAASLAARHQVQLREGAEVIEGEVVEVTEIEQLDAK